MEHHAYLIVGSKESGTQHARALFSLGDERNAPDVHFLSYDVVGIDDARLLQRWAYQRPVVAKKRYFIITCDGLTHETQNALLKLFEEPPETSSFALVVSHEEQILPTLRSRFTIERVGSPASQYVRAKEFLALSYAERVEEIARQLKEKEKEKEKGEGWVRLMLNDLEGYLYTQNATGHLHTILFARKYIERRGASVKMLLENMALSLPVM